MRTNGAVAITHKGPDKVDVTLLWAELPNNYLCTQMWVASDALVPCRFRILGEVRKRRWRIHSVTPLDPLPPGITYRSVMRLKTVLHAKLEEVLLMPVTQWSYELIDTGSVVVRE